MSYKHVGGLFSAGGVRGVRRWIVRMVPTFTLIIQRCNILNITFKMELSVNIFNRFLNENATTDQLVTFFRKTQTSLLDLSFQTVGRQPASSVFGVSSKYQSDDSSRIIQSSDS